MGIRKADIIKQEKMKKKKKGESQTNEKASRSHTLQQKSHRKDKNQSFLLCKFILKIDERRTQINGPENKKVDDHTQCLKSER